MASLYPPYPPNLEQNQLDHLLFTLKDWTIAHGLAVRPSLDLVPRTADPKRVLAVPAPVTVFPSLFPRRCFEEARHVQTSYNLLYARISQDVEWLGNVVGELAEVDDFIGKLWNVHEKVKREGYVQSLSLGLFRSDYLVHVDPADSPPTPKIRQVEFNTISSSFGGLSTKVAQMHRYLGEIGAYPSDSLLNAGSQPPSEATKSLAEGIHEAHQAYLQQKARSELPHCVLFVVQDPERNIFDQRHIEYAVRDKGVLVFRLPFSSTLKQTTVSEDAERILIFRPPHAPSVEYEVSVVYFRSTYTPSDFPDGLHWTARYQIERSAAIKCPSILTHLAGSKKVQQVLATPSSPHLSRFLPVLEVAESVRKTFAAIYPLDDSKAGQEAKKLATDPERSKGYVLKPQREGGGNNIYRGAIPDSLRSMGDEVKWRGHILMELIEPPSQRNSIFREGIMKSGEVIAELGIFGTCLWSSDGGIKLNEEAGYLLRTKGRESEEGGVAAGFGSIDSVNLIDL